MITTGVSAAVGSHLRPRGPSNSTALPRFPSSDADVHFRESPPSPLQRIRRNRCCAILRRRPSANPMVVLLVGTATLAFVVFAVCYRIHRRQSVDLEMESPIDFVLPSLLTPPFLLLRRFGGRGSSACAVVPRRTTAEAEEDTPPCALPPIFMLSGRTESERNRLTRNSWNGTFAPAKVVDGLSYPASERKRDRSAACRLRGSDSSFRYRLFDTYRWMFEAALLESGGADTETTNGGGFVFVEDDAELIDRRGFSRDVCAAASDGLSFFSLFGSGSSGGCSYMHGTVAFYASRSFMEKIVHTGRRSDHDVACRLPIDLYIASLGPWAQSCCGGGGTVAHNGDGVRTRLHLGRKRS